MNSFNPELQLKDTEYAIKNKLINLLIKLKDFKFETTLILEFEKIESNDKTKYNTFIGTQNHKQLLMKVTLIMYLNQSITLLCQTY